MDSLTFNPSLFTLHFSPFTGYTLHFFPFAG